MTRFRTVYYEHRRPAEQQRAFPTGEAGFVVLGADGEWSAETEVWISPNSHCALRNHGVAEQLAELSSALGSIEGARDLLISPGRSENAAHLFYEADRKTYGDRYDFVVLEQELPEPVRYRVAIDNREYQQTLSRLQFLATRATRNGYGLRLSL